MDTTPNHSDVSSADATSAALSAPKVALHKHALDFWLARAAVLVTAGLNAVLINNLTILPWWLGSVVEVALLVPLSIATASAQHRIRHARSAHHWRLVRLHRRWIRWFAILLTAVVTAINFTALSSVTHALLYGAKGASGQSLLIDALNIWFTNVVVFALWFWNLDRGGPATRDLHPGGSPDLLFPQMVGDLPHCVGWTPGFIDYFFVAFTNATAFSPTDTMPLTARVKLLFIVQSAASLLTVGLVAARAVNVLS